MGYGRRVKTLIGYDECCLLQLAPMLGWYCHCYISLKCALYLVQMAFLEIQNKLYICYVTLFCVCRRLIKLQEKTFTQCVLY